MACVNARKLLTHVMDGWTDRHCSVTHCDDSCHVIRFLFVKNKEKPGFWWGGGMSATLTWNSTNYSMHKSCTLGFHGTRVSYQFNIRHYVCRNVPPLVHFCTSMLLISGYQEYFHHHVTPIPQTANSLERRAA
jgi:hypothetical protein